MFMLASLGDRKTLWVAWFARVRFEISNSLSNSLHISTTKTGPARFSTCDISIQDGPCLGGCDCNHHYSNWLFKHSNVCVFPASKTTLVWLEIESAGGIHYPLAAGLFTIYECKRLTTCRSCSTSQFGCVWCLAEGRCLSTAEMLRHGTTCAAAESLPDQQPQQPRSPGCNTIQNGSVLTLTPHSVYLIAWIWFRNQFIRY